MDWLSVTLAMYRSTFERAVVVALRNWPVLGSVFAYSVILGLAFRFAPLLGLLGGLIMSAVSSACIGSFLYLVETMVRSSRVTLADFRKSFGAYFWDVVGVTFILWLFWQIAVPVLLQTPQGGALVLGVNLVLLVLFNAVPELIYLGRHSIFELLSESYGFIVENWLEWFPPNILLLAIFVLLAGFQDRGLAGVLKMAIVGLFIFFAMVLRGFLFLELSGSSRRSRLFRYNARR